MEQMGVVMMMRENESCGDDDGENESCDDNEEGNKNCNSTEQCFITQLSLTHLNCVPYSLTDHH